MAPRQPPFEFAGRTVPAGKRTRIELSVASLPTGSPMGLPVAVLHGRMAGPVIWLSAAIHGDELNGVQIIGRLLREIDVQRLAGTVIAVPVVNVFGFIGQSRYLPDRRDLNRSFPGSARGSLAARTAHIFLEQVVMRCTYGIDLHTGSGGRANLPQIRADLDDPETLRCARAFGAPISLQAKLRDGSLRQVANQRGIHTLLYEAGEALRFSEPAILAGVAGVQRVLACLEMLEGASAPPSETRLCRTSRWLRAGRSGVVTYQVRLGDAVESGQTLAVVADTFGEKPLGLRAPEAGVVIALSKSPLANRGDALIHLASVEPLPEARR